MGTPEEAHDKARELLSVYGWHLCRTPEATALLLRDLSGVCDELKMAALQRFLAWVPDGVDVALRLLEEHGLDIDCRCDPSILYTADTLLATCAKGGNLAAVEALLRAGASTALASSELGWTALHAAADGGSASVVRCLMRHGANPRAVDNEGNAPFDVAQPSVADLCAAHDPPEENCLDRFFAVLDGKEQSSLKQLEILVADMVAFIDLDRQHPRAEAQTPPHVEDCERGGTPTGSAEAWDFQPPGLDPPRERLWGAPFFLPAT
jgi:hypothetical protein